MLKPSNVKTITDMRENANRLLDQTQKSLEPLYIFYRSKPRAVLLNLTQYNKLRDLAEDYLDSLKAQEYETIDKTKINWKSHKQLLKELKLRR